MRAGALETLSCGSAATVTAGAVAVHRQARGQAQRAGASALEASRSFDTLDAATTGFTRELGMSQIDRAASSALDAGQASALTSKIDRLASHAADLAATYERDLLTTAVAARELADSYPREEVDLRVD